MCLLSVSVCVLYLSVDVSTVCQYVSSVCQYVHLCTCLLCVSMSVCWCVCQYVCCLSVCLSVDVSAVWQYVCWCSYVCLLMCLMSVDVSAVSMSLSVCVCCQCLSMYVCAVCQYVCWHICQYVCYLSVCLLTCPMYVCWRVCCLLCLSLSLQWCSLRSKRTCVWSWSSCPTLLSLTSQLTLILPSLYLPLSLSPVTTTLLSTSGTIQQVQRVSHYINISYHYIVLNKYQDTLLLYNWVFRLFNL